MDAEAIIKRMENIEKEMTELRGAITSMRTLFENLRVLVDEYGKEVDKLSQVVAENTKNISMLYTTTQVLGAKIENLVERLADTTGKMKELIDMAKQSSHNSISMAKKVIDSTFKLSNNQVQSNKTIILYVLELLKIGLLGVLAVVGVKLLWFH